MTKWFNESMNEYPEHEKLQLVADKSQTIAEFLDFGLKSQGLYLCKSIENENNFEEIFIPEKRSIEHILATYFEIDLVKLEEEKRAMLKEYKRRQYPDE